MDGPDAIYFDGTRFDTTTSAAKQFDFAPDYLTRLCREGKIRGRLVGRRWYVDPTAIQRFITAQEEQREALSRERREEYQRAAALRAAASHTERAGSRRASDGSSHLPAMRFAKAVTALALIAAAATTVAIPQAGSSVLFTLADVAALAVGNSDAWQSLDHKIAIAFGATNSVAQSAQSAAAASALANSAATLAPAVAATTAGSGTSATPIETAVRAASSQNSVAPQTYGPQTIIERITEQPIIEQTAGAQSLAVSSGFVTEDELNASVSALGNSLRQLIQQNYEQPLISGPSAPISALNFAPSQQIDQLNGTTITNANLTASEIPTDIVAANYLPLSGGTLTGALDVPTLSASSTSYGTLTSADASTTNFSVFANAYFGGTATSSFDSAGDLSVAGNTTLANATSTNFFSTTASSTNLFATNANFGAATINSLTGTSNNDDFGVSSTVAAARRLFSLLI